MVTLAVVLTGLAAVLHALAGLGQAIVRSLPLEPVSAQRRRRARRLRRARRREVLGELARAFVDDLTGW